jgi:hypothetical protein
MVRWALLGLLMMVAVSAWAANLSGAWSTTLSLGGETPAFWHTWSFRLSFQGWELQGLSTLQSWNLTSQSFTLSGQWGPLGVAGGLMMKGVPEINPAPWSPSRFQVVAGFISFELSLGNLRFRLTLGTGSGEP